MMDARYILLIHKQFDLTLSERETYELQGYLAGNEAASRLCQNLTRLIEECEQLETPEHLRPIDAEYLLQQIVTRLSQSQSQSWITLVKKLVKGGSRQSSVEHKDELEVLRSKHKSSSSQPKLSPDSTTIERTAKTMESIRARVLAEVAPVAQSDAVSLAEAIKRRMLKTEPGAVGAKPDTQLNEETSESATFEPAPHPPLQFPGKVDVQPTPLPISPIPSTETFQPTPVPTNQIPWNENFEPTADQTWQTQWELAPMQPTFRNDPPPQPISQSMDMIFNSSSTLPIYTHREELAVQPDIGPSLNAEPKTEQKAVADKLPNVCELLKPAPLIPVDEIIAHVSNLFSERIPTQAPAAVQKEPTTQWQPEQSGPPEDPLGTSGPYQQITSMDLQRANAARLAITSDTIEQNGHITSLGKFLLDKSSEEAIGAFVTASANLSGARILSDEEAVALQECLQPIENQPGVAGCIILGYDGMIITSTLPQHVDRDAFSTWALLTYMNTHELVRAVGHNKLRQLVSRTQTGYLLLADFGQGLLLAVSDNASTDAMVPLMKSVRRVAAA